MLTAGAIGLRWILLILLGLIRVPVCRVMLEVGCVEIREAGVCGGRVFYERIVGQCGWWTGRAIVISVHRRGVVVEDKATNRT